MHERKTANTNDFHPFIHENKEPKDGVRDGVKLSSWRKLPESLIMLDSLGGNKPKWATFLELTEEEQKGFFNKSAYALVFVKKEGRWFAVSFGFGHVKLKLDVFEQDFGLRVVLNTVDPDKLRSADIRTPDENTHPEECKLRVGRIKRFLVLM